MQLKCVTFRILSLSIEYQLKYDEGKIKTVTAILTLSETLVS